MNVLRAIGRFCYDFVIGDDWKIAAAVVLSLAIGAVLAAFTSLPPVALGLVTGVLLLAAFTTSMIIDTRQK